MTNCDKNHGDIRLLHNTTQVYLVTTFTNTLREYLINHLKNVYLRHCWKVDGYTIIIY